MHRAIHHKPYYIAHWEESSEYKVIPAADYSADFMARAMPSRLVFGYYTDVQLSGALASFPDGVSAWMLRRDSNSLQYLPVAVEGEGINCDAQKCADELNELSAGDGL